MESALGHWPISENWAKGDEIGGLKDSADQSDVGSL